MGSRVRRLRRRVGVCVLFVLVALSTGILVFEVGRHWVTPTGLPPVSAARPAGDPQLPAHAQAGGTSPGESSTAARAWAMEGPREHWATLDRAPARAEIAVPEPAPSLLWILGFAALYALYLPPRSC